MENSHVVWWVQICPVPECWAHQVKKGGRWSDASITPRAYSKSLISGCFSWSRFSNFISSKTPSANYLNLLIDQSFSINELLLISDGMGMFQNDNVRIHQAHIVKDGLSESKTSFSQMDRPPQWRPHLNPAEILIPLLCHGKPLTCRHQS